MSDTFSYEDAAKPAQPIKDAVKPFSYEEATGETTERGLKGWGRDIAATAVKGAIAVPEALVGLADIPTGGAVGKFLENEGGAVGFRPKQAKEIVNEWHSDATKEAQRKFQEADGIVDKAATAIQNPSLIATAVGESLGPMGAGAVAARGLMAARGALAARGATKAGLGEAAAVKAAEQASAKFAPYAGAAGEGLTMAGSAAEQIRQETPDGLLTLGQSALAGATGLVGGAVGVGGAKLAQRLGVGDADTMLAQGMSGIARQNSDEAAAAAANPLVQQQAAKSIPRSVIEGAISEGLFEELPQSVTEQVLQNIALGKDWHQDVDAAVVMGALSGGAMGGAAAGFRSATRPGETEARAPAPSPVPPAPGQPPQPGPVLGLPAPDRGVIEVASDGTARTPAYQAPGYVGDVTDVEPKAIDPVREQVATAAAQGGALSSAALTAIDTGAAAAVQPAEPEAALPAPISLEEADARDRAAYEQFFASADADPVVGRYFENDDDIPDFDAASNVSDEDFLRALGATDEDIQDAIATARQPASPQSRPAVDAGAQANEPAGTGQGAGAVAAGQEGEVAVPTSLRDGLAKIRAQKQQEAANAQAATPEAAPATTSVSAARPGAVETAGPAPDIKAITAKQIPDMTDVELQQAIAHYGPTHKRTAKLQKEVQRRAGAPSSATTEETANVHQTAQAQQAAAQPAQAAAPIAKGLTDGAATANPGAQAASAAGPQAQAQTPDQIRRARLEREISTGTTNNGGVVASLRPSAIEKRKQDLADMGERGLMSDAAQGQAQSSQVEGLRQQLRDVETKILLAAPSRIAQGGGDIEAAMKSSKVPVTLKAQRKKLVEQVRAAQAAEMQSFTPETGTLGIPRADMPQVPTQSHGGLVKHLNAHGIAHETNPNATKQGRALMAAVDEARRAGATNEEIAQADTGSTAAAPSAAELTLDDQLKQVNNELADQGQVKNARTRAKRDQIRTAIAERDFPTILKAVDGNVDMAEAINQALQFAGDEPKAKVIERVLKNRGISDEYRQLWAERLMDGETSAASADAAPAAETKPATVVIPPAIEAALDADMQAQKARITRLRNAAVAEGQTLEQKKTAQTQLKGAESTLQTMRRTRFDAEDAALKAIEQKDMAPFAEHIAFFKTEKALQEMLGAAGKERNPDGRPKTAADKAMERIAAEDAADRGEALRTAAAPAKPAPKKKPNADQTRAKADLMNALADLGDILGKNARMNIMPEQEQRLLPVLTRVLDAAFRLGYHKFKDAAKFALDQIRANLGDEAADALTLDHMQGAYIAMAGGKEGADTKRAVIDVEAKSEIEAHEATTAEEEADTMEPAQAGADQNEGNANERTELRSEGPQALGEVAATEGGGIEGGRRAGASPADGRQERPATDAGADAAGLSPARGGGSGPGRVRSAQARGGRRAGAVGAPGDGRDGARVPQDDGRVAVSGGEASAPNIPAADFQITDEVGLGRGGEVQKFNDNLAAIRTLKRIEADNRRATPDEQALLARYVGWGGLANAFPDPVSGAFKDKWQARGEELRELLTAEEYKAARRSTRNAHYTSQTVVSAMWDAVRRLGYRGGLVLESSMGSGNFLGLAPKDMAHRFVGVEYDSLTARIGQALYPQATVLHSGFQKVPVPDNAFMLNIGNPPFGSESLRFQFKPELHGVSIHNQFFRAGMDALRPGGIQAMVVSRFLMDAQDKGTRLAMAKQARLVAAIRLPDTAFKENARTEVVTDILIFQKLEPGEQAAMAVAVEEYQKLQAKKKGADAEAAALVPAWVETAKLADPLGGEAMTVNAYFERNPKNVLGVLERSGSMAHGADITVRLDKPQELAAMLREAVGRLPENIQNIEREVLDATAARHKSLSDALRIAVANEEAGAVKFNPDGKLLRVIERDTPEGDYEFAYQEITEHSPWSEALSQDANGHWYSLEAVTGEDGKPVKALGKDGKPGKKNLYERKVYARVEDVPQSMRLGALNLQRLTGLVKLRDLLKRQLVLETADAVPAVMEGNRKALAQAYAEFVKANGPVNRATNLRLAMTMPDGGLVAALEVGYQPERSAEQATRSGLDRQKEKATAAPILRERVVPKYEPATKAATPSDALAITLAERGRVDMERIAALLGVEQAQAAEQLQQGEPLVFQDPETQTWETADAYLSGQVKRKLNAARAAGMAQNVQALEKVIPEDWTAENVAVQMGATWVPADVYAGFLEHLTGGQAKVHFSQATNSFSTAVSGVNPAKAGQWGTEDVGAEHIVGRILNSKAVTVTRTDGEGNTYVDKEATALAGLKAREVVAEFGDWVFKDGERRQRLVFIFNEKNNTRVARQYNGQHLQLPGKVPDSIIQMRRHQTNAIWRGIYERFMLVDHAVGAGKTFTAIARAMERRRMGLSRKPMIVVPNHLVEQWAADVYRLYPGAKVLAAGKKDFEAKRRRRLLGKVATGDWDIVIVPHSSFGFIGIAPETESRYLELEMAQAKAAIEEAWEQAKEDGTDGGRRKPFNVKEAERLAEKIQARMDRLAEGVRDRLLTFEQLGVDDLTVDEAHEFKNLYYSSNLTGVRGMGDKTGSRKANDLYNKVRALSEQPTGSVTFLTGTPISNSAVEMFTMLRYLAADSLQEMGLEHFDAFRAQFVEATPAFEPTESGRLKEVTRLGRTWSNMRSLMTLYYQVTDAVSLQDIQRWYAEDNAGQPFPVPKVAGGKDRALVAIQPTAAQEQGLREVMAGFDGLDGIEDPYERNAERLRLMDRARKLSLDIRAVDPRHPSAEKGGKLQVVSENIKRIYDKWHADKGTQLVFLDRSVPKAKGDDKLLKEYDALVERRDKAAREGNQEGFDDAQEALDKYDANEIAELRAAQSSSWNAYQQIKDNLIASGIPAHEIRFVQEAANDEQKAALFDAVNGGKVRVLIGSTPRMGAGTNVQQRAVALHHVDVTWKPSDIEQREGRVIRQGNSLLEQYGQDFEVEILAYATERTVDAKMWDLNATKLRTINGIRKYDGAFTMEFEDAEAVGMAEMAALASGNPLLLERVQLESAIGNLELQERAHRRKMWGIEDEVDRAEKAIARNPGLIAEARQRTEDARERIAAVDKAAEGRAVTVEGRRFDKLREAFAAAEDAVKLQQGGNDKARYAITIDGERVSSKEAITDAIGAALGDVDTFEAAIDGKRTYQRTVAARDMAKSLNARTYEQDGNVVLPLGTLYGYELVADVDVATDKGERVKNLRLSLMNGERTVASADANEQPAQVVFTTTNIRAPLEKLVDAVRAASSGTNADFLERQLERAKRDLPELRERQGQGFPKAGDLAQKRARLTEVVKDLEGAAPAVAAEPVQAGAEASEAFFGASPTSNTGTATDRAIMDMVRTGEPARDILGLVSESSRDPWRRDLAQRLLASGAVPSVRLERGELGAGEGFAFLAKYSRVWDEVVMTPGAGHVAEQIFLHEMVHAATLKSLDRKGLASIQMRNLFEHVKATGTLDGHYGMKNVGEFVAEAFTNPKFQQALRQLPAPKGSTLQNAWDALVRIVRSMLGLPQKDHDALARALELGAAVMREDKALRARGVQGRGRDAPAGMNQTQSNFDPDDADADVAYFGAADLRTVKKTALDQITQTLSHPGKVSLWDKTVGTMRNLAERVPQFKPVFESAQRFIDDVSMLANESADAAPRLLPRVDSWRDLAKKPISAADNQAVAKPLFEGTLMWARDVDGKPALVSDLEGKYASLSADDKAQMMLKAGRIDPGVLKMWQGLPVAQYEAAVNSRFSNTLLKGGVVWTDKELADIFKATPEQAGLYREARATIDRSIDMTARADMLRLLGEEYAPMRDAVLEAPSLQEALTLLVETLEQDAQADFDSRERLADLMHGLRQRHDKAQELMDQGYAPLSRFGRYTVDVVDQNGERQYFGMFESMRDANLMKLRMASAFPGATVNQGTMSQEAYKLFAGITPESLELFGNMLGLGADGADAQDKAFQEYLKLAKNNHSALKRLIHRQGIAGYSEDVGRVLASFVYSNARLGAGGLNAGTMENAIGAIPKEMGELKDVAMGLKAYIQDPQEEGQAVRGMLFAQYLGGSLASAFVNTTQPFAVTLPWLSQFGGMKKAGAQLARALKDMGTKGFRYEPALANALKHAEDDGVVSPQEVHQLMAQARGAGSLRVGDGTRMGDARAAAANHWERAKVAWGQPFALAEQFNRRSTFIAAHRIAQAQGMANPAEFARKAVLETQFLYSKANKMRWARGTVGGTLMTFKTYSASYLELMHRMWTQGGPEGKRAVGWAVAMLLLMGGAGGLPFMEDAEDLIDGAGQLMGYNLSVKQWRKQLLSDVVGKEFAEFLEQGVSGLPGAPVDVSGRLGMGNLIPGTGLFMNKPNRERDLMEIAGPAGDLVKRGFVGGRKLLTGDVGGAALEVSPAAVRNAAKGADMAASGMYKDQKGYKVIDTTLPEAAAKFLGFQPKSVAEVQEANSFMLRSKSFYTQTSSDIKAQWAQALFEKDDAALERVRARLDAWNRDNPEQRIVVKIPDVMKRVREMGKDRSQRIADTAPKALRQQMREMAQDASR